MPVKCKRDSKGPYCQWGGSGKKYRYTAGNKAGRDAARNKAEKQGAAAHASGFKE